MLDAADAQYAVEFAAAYLTGLSMPSPQQARHVGLALKHARDAGEITTILNALHDGATGEYIGREAELHEQVLIARCRLTQEERKRVDDLEGVDGLRFGGNLPEDPFTEDMHAYRKALLALREPTSRPYRLPDPGEVDAFIAEVR